jgi:putative effector of murein hydrolase
MATYLAGTEKMTWLITPATVSLALPLYEQLKKLKGQLFAILGGVIAGAVSSLALITGTCLFFAIPREITVSLLPKSITTAMAMVLAEQSGGISSIAAGGVAVAGLVGSLLGPMLCKLFRFKDPIAQGVAYGTASHVIGTSRVMEINPLSGAVSTLSLVVAGVLTAILMPILCAFI